MLAASPCIARGEAEFSQNNPRWLKSTNYIQEPQSSSGSTHCSSVFQLWFCRCWKLKMIGHLGVGMCGCVVACVWGGGCVGVGVRACVCVLFSVWKKRKKKKKPKTKNRLDKKWIRRSTGMQVAVRRYSLVSATVSLPKFYLPRFTQ